ncbi:unnamed protein product [Nezara viridula]|uniref:Uncharacterized protein n=1 Tax=Nezara viridula TaxID=85310 RepID=A0A9P0H1X0_NEZVI|nr:unnamed protein product [Nezara viridula]
MSSEFDTISQHKADYYNTGEMTHMVNTIDIIILNWIHRRSTF